MCRQPKARLHMRCCSAGPPGGGKLLAMQEVSGNLQDPHKRSHGCKAAAHLQRPRLRIHRCCARALGPGLLPGSRPPLQLPQLQHLLLHSALHSSTMRAPASSTDPVVLKLDVAGSQASDRRSWGSLQGNTQCHLRSTPWQEQDLASCFGITLRQHAKSRCGPYQIS